LSTRRTLIRLLALYIDFIVIGTFVTLGNYAFGVAIGYIPGIGNSWYVEIGVSAGLTALARMLGLSLGEALLEYALDEADFERRGRLWPNLLLGTFLMLDGLKLMVRWSQLDVAVPVFGLVETTALKVIILVAMGLVSVVAGAMLLAFQPMSRLAAAGSLALSAFSLAMSWPVLEEAIERVQVARREAQGLPIREGEIESMQAMLPFLSVSMLAVGIVLLLLSRERSS
jgi:hypothetical protein